MVFKSSWMFRGISDSAFQNNFRYQIYFIIITFQMQINTISQVIYSDGLHVFKIRYYTTSTKTDCTFYHKFCDHMHQMIFSTVLCKYVLHEAIADMVLLCGTVPGNLWLKFRIWVLPGCMCWSLMWWCCQGPGHAGVALSCAHAICVCCVCIWSEW